jgi:hypothetical protein
MHNFGLECLQMQKVTAVELEIMEEKASALGITGRRLEAALAEYRGPRQGGTRGKKPAELIAGISNNLHELLIQREAMGIPHANVEWVLRSYDIPQEILSRLGLRDDPDLLFRA